MQRGAFRQRPRSHCVGCGRACSEFYVVHGLPLTPHRLRKTDGSRFHNTEVFTFVGEKIARVEVYFGWNLW